LHSYPHTRRQFSRDHTGIWDITSIPIAHDNRGNYVEILIHQPPPKSVAASTVAQLDLAKNFEMDRLYHLLHLRYGCPGVKQMEMILKGDKTQGVPANVTIPEFF
jgi:hypothetical protein